MNDKLKQIGIEGSIFGDNAQVSIEQNLILPPVQEQAKQNLHNLPNSGAAKFVGRDEVLTGLATQLRETDRVAIAALTGMGGLGKSELALRYAWREWENKTYLGGVVWLTVAESDPGLSLLTFAQVHLGLRLLTEGELAERVRFCWQNWFRNEQDQALIIFDDVRKVEQIRDFLPPPDRRFKVIITTRNEQIARNFNPINLEVLSSDAAVELLAVFLPDAVASHPEKAQELANCLGYLPLGIELAGRYGQYMGLGLGELLERLQAQKLRDASLQVPENALMTAQRGVAAAFELSWGELSAGSRLAGEWLSLFAESGIPEHLALALFEERSSSLEKQPGGITEILQRYLPTFSRWFGLGRSPQPPLERGAIQGSSLESEAMESGSVEMEGIDLLKPSREDLRHLVNLNLLIDVGNNCYELHTLIRYYLREKLEASALKDEAKRTYGRVMVGIAQTVEQTLSLEDIAKLEPYIEHLKVAAEELYQWLDDEDLFWPFTGLGRFYSAQGLYPQAAPYFESCLTLSEQRFGKNHPEVAASLNNLAELYHDQGKYGEAELLHRRSLAIMEKQLGADHPHVATSLNNLAGLYDNQGKYGEAEPLYRLSLAIREQQLGSDHPDVATSLNNLAVLYNSQGKYAEAEPLYRRSLAIREKQLGADHPHVATSLNNLAGLYDNQGKYGEAEPLYRHSLAIREQQLGADHPHVANSLNNLALLYDNQGKYGEAEPLYRRSLAIREQQLGADHPHVATSLNNLADLYRTQGKYGEAEPLYRRSLAILEKQLGTDHPDVATSLNNLALLYDNQGKYAEAEPLYRRSLAIKEKQLGFDHPDVVIGLNNLASLCRDQGKYEEAEPLYQRAIAICSEKLGENHPNTQTVIMNLFLMLSQFPDEELNRRFSPEMVKYIQSLRQI